MNDLPRISILLRTFNSGGTLDELLSRMDFEEGDEVVVVDSGSSDLTLEIATKHSARIIRAEGPFNYSRSLNLGFQAAACPWVLVISSHCIPIIPGFLGIYRREVLKFERDVVVGYAPSTLSGKSDPGLDSEKTQYFSKVEYPEVARVCGNGNTIYRRSAWEELTFDETIRTAEDKIWIMDMIQRGYRFAYVPQARGLNMNQASLAYMFRKGYSDARALRSPSHRPMKPLHLAGALRKLLKQKLRGEINNRNFAAYSAHTFGQFFGSYKEENNTPNLR